VLSRQRTIGAACVQDTVITERVNDTHELYPRKKLEPVPAKPHF
jgi:hypothetical protein